MALTRKVFLLRASAATAGVVATSLAGAGTAEAGAEPHLRSVLELTTNAARQLERIASLFPPGPCMPQTQADLEAIIAASADVSATAGRLLGACRG
jgi:hypothetical protein